MNEKGGLSWAVVGFSRDNYTEEFISSHPMDFFEDISEVPDGYKVYLSNEHDGFVPMIEYKSSGKNSFKSSLVFWGTAPNYAGEGDFRLKHLRMMLGTEDYPFFPCDFADSCKILGNKQLTVDYHSFSSDTTVDAIVKWVREFNEKHSIINQNAVLVYEGEDIVKAGDLHDELENWFSLEIENTWVFCEDVDPNAINISIWSYEPSCEVRGLRESWDRFYDWKELYISGEKELDMPSFCDLVRRTWMFIEHFKVEVDSALEEGRASCEVRRSFLSGLMEYMRMVERLTYYSVLPEKDNSKDYTFTVSAMLADELARLAGGKESGRPGYNFYGDFMGLGGTDMDVTLAAEHPSNPDRVFYDIESMNYEVLYDAAKRINENK